MMMKRYFVSILALFALTFGASAWHPAGDRIKTVWGESLTPENVWDVYPRPQMQRERWQSLNGLWKLNGGRQILVPFAIESSLSGIGEKVPEGDTLVYSREFSVPKQWKGERILLHFDAVDWYCELYVNGKFVGSHSGGYTAFGFDITEYLKGGRQNLVLKVVDGTDNDRQPRGKQVRDPKAIWYTSVTGIWQSVWMEPVSAFGYISDFTIKNDIHLGSISVSPSCIGAKPGDKVAVKVSDGGKEVASAVCDADGKVVAEIDKPHLWSPDDPHLYDIEVSMLRDGKTIDKLSTYTAMREIGIKEDNAGHKRLALNGKILFQYGPLDQGWWPDGLYTAPCDEALRYDIEQTKAFGFNMIRKHIKVEPARWYYWCDKLGVMVWQDMPSITATGNVWGQLEFDSNGNNFFDSGTDCNFSKEVKANYYKEWGEIMSQLDKFQCIVMWVPFNEAWGQFDTRKAVEFTRSHDSGRLVNAASGGNWVSGAIGDVLDSHHYPNPKMRLMSPAYVNVLGEYGGIGLPLKGHLWQEDRNWGYIQYKDSREVTDKYVEYSEELKKLVADGCAAAVYTQTTDVEIEVNGLMTYDRKIEKLDKERVASANRSVISNGITPVPSSAFEAVKDGKKISLVTITGGGLTMQATNCGGRVVSLFVPDKDGKYDDVVIGYGRIEDYLDNKGERFLGSSPGPVANRIGGASFGIDGTTYKVSANDGANTLHGGFTGIDNLVWDIESQTENSVTFSVVHPDGLDGFPGNKKIRMTYTLTEDSGLMVEFEASTDKKTPVNLAHHSFFNLHGSGKGNILDHVLTIKASKATPVDEHLIPTGEIASIEGTPLDFRTPHAIGERVDDYSNQQMAYGHGYDFNYVLDKEHKGMLESVAMVFDPVSGRRMEVLTDQPGLQFYSGYFFDGTSCDKYGNKLGRNCSFALETQKFPDAVHHGNFPSIILNPGETYRHKVIYRFSR